MLCACRLLLCLRDTAPATGFAHRSCRNISNPSVQYIRVLHMLQTATENWLAVYYILIQWRSWMMRIRCVAYLQRTASFVLIGLHLVFFVVTRMSAFMLGGGKHVIYSFATVHYIRSWMHLARRLIISVKAACVPQTAPPVMLAWYDRFSAFCL